MGSGPPWSREDIGRLWSYAERVSQSTAARRLGRSVTAIASKARELGILWRGGAWSYRRVAAEVGCSHRTVARMADILYPDGEIASYGSGHARRVMLDWDQAQRLVRVLRGVRGTPKRQQQIRAGRRRHELQGG